MDEIAELYTLDQMIEEFTKTAEAYQKYKKIKENSKEMFYQFKPDKIEISNALRSICLHLKELNKRIDYLYDKYHSGD